MYDVILFFYFANGLFCGAVILHEFHKMKKHLNLNDKVMAFFAAAWNIILMLAFFYILYQFNENGNITLSIKRIDKHETVKETSSERTETGVSPHTTSGK